MDLNLGVVGNSIIAALIDREGQIVWSCIPRLDGDPVFCGLLAKEGEGVCAVDLIDRASSEQSYLGNTAILTTTLTDKSGAKIRITDFAPRFRQYERIFRPMMLIRRIEPLSGMPRIRVRMRPRFEYGAVTPTVTHGSNHIRYQSSHATLRLTTDAPIAYLLE